MSERRIPESDLVIPALRLAAQKPNGEISTAELVVELTELFRPSGQDAEILNDRHDTYFSQKVRNLVSHKNQPSSFIKKGYAEYTGDGIRITDKGRKLLEDIGS